jgi:predicted ATP-dependent endonuclease of OLD family
VLLQSASANLTSKFRDWWKQGNYLFDFHADGNHFRIWVSDDQRPEKVELEGRSTGLQWFLSFYLIFLVESQESHEGAILLLDEAGLSLHPLAQKDLSKFFENLSETNQLINTTHSPFLVDTNHVDRVKVVYIDNDGCTVASNDLRAAEDKSQSRSVYAVHAALGLSISDTLLQGCKPVIVEGPSDQFYLNAIKNYLISEKLIAPRKEIVFVPSGGVKGVEGVASLVSGKSDDLPHVVLDSDKPGQDFKNKLLKRLYKDSQEKIVEVNELRNINGCEIEDIIPFPMLRSALNRLFRDVETKEFEDVYNHEVPIVPQIESFAEGNEIDLVQGWKVEIARQAKQRLLQQGKEVVDEQTLQYWKVLFEKICKVYKTD